MTWQQLRECVDFIICKLLKSVAVCTFLLLGSASFQVSAQDATSEQGTAPQPELKAFKDWVVQCTQAESGAPKACVMFYRILLDNGYPLLVFQITRAETEENKGKYIGIFNVPLGAHLPSGIGVAIDDAESLDLDFERCDQNGCYAGTLLDSKTITALKRGREAKVKFTDVASQIITATVSLSGFTAGLNEL